MLAAQPARQGVAPVLAACTLAACLALAGCMAPQGRSGPGAHGDGAAHVRPGTDPSQAAARPAYQARERGSVATRREDWLLGGQRVDVLFTGPAGGRSSPLVVYLPGLGESSDAGARWRQAWAAAGYAVLSVQLLDSDAAAWRSELARSGEFKALGRLHYAPDAMQRRLAMLQAVLAHAQGLGSAGAAPWASIDWQRAALAGHDLGAYTVLAAAGERVSAVQRPATGATASAATSPTTADAGPAALPRWRAAIALSPFAATAAEPPARYAGIQTPVLAVTGEADGDPLGLVDQPAWRLQPFEQMPGPDKWLLTVHDLPHAGFSGNPPGPAEAGRADTGRGRGSSAPEGGAGRGGKGGGGGGGPGGGSGGGGQHRGGGASGGGAGAGAGAEASQRSRSSRGQDPGAGQLPAAVLQARQAWVQDVSTAFLDAQLRDDPAARDWLASTAPAALGAAGTLRRK
jgi:uncharacterized membrane protein YgcG